jgi:hypothetical protein
MPELTKVLTTEDLASRPRGVNLDLSVYLEMIDTITRDGGVGATVTLGEDERQRTEKRRLSMAAKQQGYRLVWRKAAPGALRFVLAAEGEAAPGGRKRRLPPPAAPVRDTNRRRARA